MKTEDIKQVGVMGGGVMGGGIAQSLLLAGYKVIIRDINDELLDKTKDVMVNGRFGFKGGVERGKLSQEKMDQALANLTLTTKEEDLKDCDLIIEAVPERLELKQQVFAGLDKIARKEAIFASNSSFFTHAETSKDVARKSQFIGMHFFSPANIMKLVELIYTKDTSPEVIQALEEVCQRMGKTSVLVKDVPGNTGYIANRIFTAAVNEARKIVEEGVASEQSVDTAMRLGYNWPAGPFELSGGVRSGWQ